MSAVFKAYTPPKKLLRICFWREDLEAALGPERRGEKGGYGIRGAGSCAIRQHEILSERVGQM